MANKQIPGLPPLNEAPADDDRFVVRDTSSGSDKSLRADRLLGRRMGEVSFGDSSEGWARDDFESLSFDPAFDDSEYQVTFERPDSIEAQRLGDIVVYDKAPNGCKVRTTGSGGGTVRWKATR